jgi:hypothetical protein
VPESSSHILLKELLVSKLKEWYGASIDEYPSSGHELDVFAVTNSGVSIYVEIIWTPSKTQFLRDMNMLQQSDANVKLVIANPEIINNEEMCREFAKIVVSQRRQGKSIHGYLLNGERVLQDAGYVTYELRKIIDDMLSQVSVSKRPNLELLLIDGDGNALTEIHAEPTFVKRILRKSAVPALWQILRVPIVPAIGNLDIFAEKDPPKDLVPVGAQITNRGEIPAEGVRLTLNFPADCEVFEKHDIVGGISISPPYYQRNSAGLFVDRDAKRPEAHARIDTLGNDLTQSFDVVYVRFPQVEREYKIVGHITQHSFPPIDAEFLVSVKPKFIEEYVDVYDKQQSLPENKKT